MTVHLTREIIGILMVVLAVGAVSAGYFHDQSIKGIYSSFAVDVAQFQGNMDSRDSTISQLSAEKTNLLAQISSLQGQVEALNTIIADLQTQNGNLHQQIAALQNQVEQLQQQVGSLEQTVNSLNTQLSDLTNANMDGWFTFTGGGCFFGCSASVRGAWVNYGTESAEDVILIFTWWNNGQYVQDDIVNVGTVAGHEIELYPTSQTTQTITLQSEADALTWFFTWE